MYEVDRGDRVHPLHGVPQCSPGAPQPVVVGDEGTVYVAYHAADAVNSDPGKPEDLGDQEVVVLRFDGVRSMMFGSPNDEALQGHPLADRGLDPYAAHQILNSSWVRGLERMNRGHPMHSAEGFARLHHFILTFHDSTFECVCTGEPDVAVSVGATPRDAAARCLRTLGD